MRAVLTAPARGTMLAIFGALLVLSSCNQTETKSNSSHRPGAGISDSDGTAANRDGGVPDSPVSNPGPPAAGTAGSGTAATDGLSGSGRGTAQPGTDPAPGTVLSDWTVTVYYTAVERFHGGPGTQVLGCRQLECSRGDAALGTYPSSFVDAVRNEGTGRTTQGAYLNWSQDTGFWLDQAPRDTAGRPLRPFESAAADQGVLAAGATFTITGCGHDDGGEPVATEVCDRLRAAHWSIRDEFTPGLGGQRHVDVYIGEETGDRFTDGPWYVTLVGATLRSG